MAIHQYDDDTPAEIRNAEGLHLVTENTPNGQKVQIFLEELADAYGVKWTTTLLDTDTYEQKKDWYLSLNPNGRIPIVIDGAESPAFTVMETSAELLYLLKHDTDGIFGFKDALEMSELQQWLLFWHGSGAPYQGNFRFFSRAKEQSPFAISRFWKETYRVYGVLETHLSGRYTGVPKDYLAGKGKGRYSIADMATWPWVKNWKSNNIFTEDEMQALPHLLAWIDRIAKRPAVQRGIGEKYAKRVGAMVHL